MKKIALLLMVLFTTTAFAQKFDNVEVTPEQSEKAHELMERYNDQLSFTSKQRRLFHDKVEEFMAKQNAVLTMDGTIEDKNRTLLAYYKEETAEMADILTRPQLDLYKKIKPEMQPLLQLK